MLAEQFTAAADGARTLAQADEVSRLVWRAFADGHLDDDAAQAASAAVEARRAAIKGARPAPLPKPPAPRRRPVSPDRAKSLERRRRLAASGVVPGRIAASFTQCETAVLSVIGVEIRKGGTCSLPIDAIAALAGCSASTVHNALRQAKAIGVIAVRERRRPDARSLTNVITVASAEWASWIKLGGQGGRVQNSAGHVIHKETTASNSRIQASLAHHRVLNA